MMMVASIGVVVGHIPGALVALVAFFLPTGLLTFFVGRLWTHLATWRWRPSIQTGLGSVAVGLVLAGAIIMGRGAITEVFFGVIALAVFLLLWRTKINPAYPIVASGLIGMAPALFQHRLVRRGPSSAGSPSRSCTRARALAACARDADRHHLVAHLQAAVAPFAGQGRSRQRHRTETVRQVVRVECLRSGRSHSSVAAGAFTTPIAIGALEAIDRLAMLGPLRHALAFLQGSTARPAPTSPCPACRDASPTCGSRHPARTASYLARRVHPS